MERAMAQEPHLNSRPTFAIRTARRQDADGILECLRSAFEPFRGCYTPEGFRDTTLTSESIYRRMTAMSVLVAVDDEGQIAGTVAYSTLFPDEGHLRGMAVIPQWQGCGLAQQLLEAVEKRLRALQCRRVTLDTTEPLQRAIRFYERNGYRASGKVGDFFGMPLYEYVKLLEPLKRPAKQVPRRLKPARNHRNQESHQRG